MSPYPSQFLWLHSTTACVLDRSYLSTVGIRIFRYLVHWTQISLGVRYLHPGGLTSTLEGCVDYIGHGISTVP